jgi:hypothetical protein
MSYLVRTVDAELDELLPLASAIALDGPKGVGKFSSKRTHCFETHPRGRCSWMSGSGFRSSGIACGGRSTPGHRLAVSSSLEAPRPDRASIPTAVLDGFSR